MRKIKFYLAVAICLLLVTSLILSAAFILTEQGHTCSGSHCRICQQIHLCEAVLEALGWSWIFLVLYAGILLHPIAGRSFSSGYSRPRTLVQLKVRLSC